MVPKDNTIEDNIDNTNVQSSRAKSVKLSVNRIEKSNILFKKQVLGSGYQIFTENTVFLMKSKKLIKIIKDVHPKIQIQYAAGHFR